MELSRKTKGIFLITVIFLIFGLEPLRSQAQIPEVLQTGTLQEQLDYIQDRTLIYNNFRAIREDMFLLVKKNSLDSLDKVKKNILELSLLLNNMNKEKDSLSNLLEDTRSELNLAIDNRDNIAFLGIPMNKTGYNLLVWVIIAILSTLLALGFLIYSRNRIAAINCKKETEGIREEFENYKTTSRERREKLVMEHFNEIKKLKER
jgi:hypothetical protein